jgi:predicted branched-subunit amino acid permease
MMISALIYAGTSQFALIGLWASHAAWWMDIAIVWLINLRHAVYGPALAIRQKRSHWITPWVLGWGLTDEVFALSIRGPVNNLRYNAVLTLCAYGAWLGGTALGLAFGNMFLKAVPSAASALTFVLPALFLTLLWHWVQPERKTWDTRVIRALGMAGVSFALLRLCGAGTLAVPLSAAVAAMAETVYERRTRRVEI